MVCSRLVQLPPCSHHYLISATLSKNTLLRLQLQPFSAWSSWVYAFIVKGQRTAPTGGLWLCCAAVLTQPAPVSVKRWRDAGGEKPSAHRAQWSVSAAASTTLDYQHTEVSLSLLSAPCGSLLVFIYLFSYNPMPSFIYLFIYILPWHRNSWLCVIIAWCKTSTT